MADYELLIKNGAIVDGSRMPAFHAIDSDGHVLEPPDFWDAYMAPAFRDRAPRLLVNTDGKPAQICARHVCTRQD